MIDLRAPKHLVLNGFPLQDSHRGRGIGRYTFEVYRHILDRWERADPQLTTAFSQISVIGAATPDLRDIFEYQFQKTNYVAVSNKIEKRNLLKYLYYKLSAGPKINDFFQKSTDPLVYFLPRHQILSNKFADYTVTMVHDFAPLRTKRWGKSKLLDPLLKLEYKLYLQELAKADLIVTNSHDTSGAVSQYLGRKQDIHAILLGNIFETVNTDEYERRPSPLQVPYFLYYSGFDYNKNIPGLIKAFALFIRKHEDTNHTKLVISGGIHVRAMLVDLARKEGILENLILIDYLSDTDLAWYLVHSLGLFRFSFVEGCGLPEIEAMAMGVPVISADIGAVREMVGDYAFLANPHHPEAVEPLLHQAARKRVDLERLLRGKSYAREFTWAKTADQTIDTIIEYTQSHQSSRVAP